MNKSLSSNDLVSTSQWAWTIYERCRDSSDEFQKISNDVKLLHANLYEAQILLKEYEWQLSPKRKETLQVILSVCIESLDDLNSQVSKYDSMATPSQRAWDRLRWGLKDVSVIKDQIKVTTTQLAALNYSLSRYGYKGLRGLHRS
jgi:hypothetical protein